MGCRSGHASIVVLERAQRAAVIPGYSHYNFMSSPEFAPYVVRFLRDSLDASAPGAAAASQAAP